VLREKDIMQADEANSPSRRIYFPVMMMYLDESDASSYHEEFIHRLQEFMGAITNPTVLADCVNISKLVLQREYYKALTLCRKLIEYEDQRLGHVATGVSAGGQAG
jgi:flagellar protein FlbT